jgi:beta-lactamase regulating signal transducer with metallopeptidase domain
MLEWIVLNTVTATALAALVLVLGRCTRLRPATRHALWLVVLLKLVTPPVVYWPWPLPGVKIVDPVGQGPLAAGIPPPAAEQPPAGGNGDIGLSLERLEILLAEVRAEREALAAPPAPPEQPTADVNPWWEVGWSDIALGLWAGGGVVVALVQVGRILRFRRLLARARHAPAWLVATTAELAERLGVRPPAVRVLQGVGSPMVWGFGPARLLWPEGLEDFLSPPAREAVLVHELAHLRRRDHWVGWLLLAGGCVWWWHPLFRFVSRQLGREAELACDAWVVGTLPRARRAYAEALLEVSQWVSRLAPACHRRLAASATPALGAAGSRLDFQRRLVMVMREETPCRLSRQVLAAVGVLALLVIPAWTLGQAPPPPAPAQAPPTVAEEKPAPETATQLLNIAQYYTRLAEARQEAQPGKAPADRDKKLDELEKKLKDLLKELQALKAGGNSPTAPPPAENRVNPGAKVDYVPTTTYQVKPTVTGNVIYEPVTTYQPVTSYVQWANTARGAGEKSAEVMLTRATYKLPTAKAEALGAFLREHVKASVMETKVEGENLIVTTTPEAQHTIAAFIALVQGKVPATRTWGTPASVPHATYPVPAAPVTNATHAVPAAAPAPAAQPIQPSPTLRSVPAAPSTQPIPAGSSPTPPLEPVTPPAKP